MVERSCKFKKEKITYSDRRVEQRISSPKISPQCILNWTFNAPRNVPRNENKVFIGIKHFVVASSENGFLNNDKIQISLTKARIV